ncbi:MAG: hypothetical protein ACSHW9_06925 [Salinibacterium amurskyense]
MSSDGIPLKVILEPGEYRVECQLPSASGDVSSISGDLKLLADRSPRGSVYGDVPLEWMGGIEGITSYPQSYGVPSVTGTLLNGLTVILVDASIEIWFPGRATIVARAALVGRESLGSHEFRVKNIKVQVEGLDSVAGIGPIGKVNVPPRQKANQQYLDWSWEALGNPESTQIWADSDAEVELRFDSSVTAPEAFFFRVTFSPVLYIRSTRPLDFDDAFSLWIEPLRRILSLATGRKERITYLSFEIVDGVHGRHFDVFGSGLHQEPYSSRGNEILEVERAFFLSPHHMSLLHLFRRWQELQTEHHPLLETYGSMMFVPEQHPRSRVLLLIQALEGMHGHENAAAFTQRTELYKQKRADVLAEIAKLSSRDVYRFLKKSVSRRPSSSLQEVLGETLAAVPVDVTAHLERSRLVVAVMRDARKPSNSFDALRLVRNDLAHGSRGYDFHALDDVAELLEGAVRAHMLRLLGCSEDSQLRAQRLHQ